MQQEQQGQHEVHRMPSFLVDRFSNGKEHSKRGRRSILNPRKSKTKDKFTVKFPLAVPDIKNTTVEAEAGQALVRFSMGNDHIRPDALDLLLITFHDEMEGNGLYRSKSLDQNLWSDADGTHGQNIASRLGLNVAVACLTGDYYHTASIQKKLVKEIVKLFGLTSIRCLALPSIRHYDRFWRLKCAWIGAVMWNRYVWKFICEENDEGIMGLVRQAEMVEEGVKVRSLSCVKFRLEEPLEQHILPTTLEFDEKLKLELFEYSSSRISEDEPNDILSLMVSDSLSSIDREISLSR